jgi:hypothetical protein
MNLETCRGRKWVKMKEKGCIRNEASPVSWHKMSVKNTSPKYIAP